MSPELYVRFAEAAFRHIQSMGQFSVQPYDRIYGRPVEDMNADEVEAFISRMNHEAAENDRRALEIARLQENALLRRRMWRFV